MDALYSSMTDEAVVKLVHDGDDSAAAVLIVRLAPAVKAIAARFSGEETEDLSQEGMIGLLSAIKSYESSKGATFRTYACTCAANRIITAVRKSSRAVETVSDDAITETAQADGSDPQNIVIGIDEADRLLDLLRKSLSDFERDVLTLYLSGESYRSIAAKLSTGEKAIDNAMQRIRKKLKAFI